MAELAIWPVSAGQSPQKAKGRPPTAKPSTTRGVQTSEGDGHDDPQESLESNLSDNREQVLQVGVDDKGSLPCCVKVEVQGVSMYGIMDSGARCSRRC